MENTQTKITFDYSKLRGKIIEKVGTLKKMSILLGISEAQMSLLLKNKANFSQPLILKSCELLDIDPKSEELGIYFFSI